MIIVFGSVNLDLTVQAARAPRAGETVLGGATAAAPGGKGANQAHAARLFGAQVAFFGAVGNDVYADQAAAGLEAAGVDVQGLRRVQGASTGLAFITLEQGGQNRIVVSPGANLAARAQQVTDAQLAGARALLLQLEVPLAESMALARRARAAGCRVLLNASPLQGGEAIDYGAVDVLIVNEGELAQLAAAMAVPPHAPAQQAQELSKRTGCDVLLTLGADGALLAGPRGGSVRTAAHRVQVADSTGAGDTFAGVFAAAGAQGMAPAQALALANAAAALSCTAAGAQPSQPQRKAIEEFLAASATRSNA